MLLQWHFLNRFFHNSIFPTFQFKSFFAPLRLCVRPLIFSHSSSSIRTSGAGRRSDVTQTDFP